MPSNLISWILNIHNVNGLFTTILILYMIHNKISMLRRKDSNLTIKKLLFKNSYIQNHTKKYNFKIYFVIIILFLIMFMLYLYYYIQDWPFLIIYCVFLVGYSKLFIDMRMFPHLMKKDLFPSYRIKNNIFVILDDINDKLLVVKLEPNELNRSRDELYHISISDDRYIIDSSQLTYCAIKYIRNGIKPRF